MFVAAACPPSATCLDARLCTLPIYLPACLPIQHGGGGAATANAVYCLRTILKDLTEQLNSEQLLSFVEVSPAVAAAAAAAGAEEQQAAAAATGGKQQAPADGGSGSGGSSPGTAAAGQGEFSPLHNNSLVHTLVCEAMLTLSDKRLM